MWMRCAPHTKRATILWRPKGNRRVWPWIWRSHGLDGARLDSRPWSRAYLIWAARPSVAFGRHLHSAPLRLHEVVDGLDQDGVSQRAPEAFPGDGLQDDPGIPSLTRISTPLMSRGRRGEIWLLEDACSLMGSPSAQGGPHRPAAPPPRHRRPEPVLLRGRGADARLPRNSPRKSCRYSPCRTVVRRTSRSSR